MGGMGALAKPDSNPLNMMCHGRSLLRAAVLIHLDSKHSQVG